MSGAGATIPVHPRQSRCGMIQTNPVQQPARDQGKHGDSERAVHTRRLPKERNIWRRQKNAARGGHLWLSPVSVSSSFTTPHAWHHTQVASWCQSASAYGAANRQRSWRARAIGFLAHLAATLLA